MAHNVDVSAAHTGEVSAAPAAGGRRLAVKLFYGLGSIAFGVKDNGFQVLLLLFYNQALGLDARLAGLAIMIALVVDAFVDPVIGYMSDRLRTRWGRRHPFMYAAAVPVSLSYLLLFSPPHGLNQAQLFVYLLASSILVRIFISVYEIPSSALVAELTDRYDERTSFISYRYFFGWMGGLTMSILAFSVFLAAGAGQGAAQLNRIGYSRYGMTAAAIMFMAIIASSLGTQSAVRPVEMRVLRAPMPRGRMYAEVWTAISSPSAMSAMAAGVLMLLATGLSFALGSYFYIYAWQLSTTQISALIATSFVAAALALVTTPLISRRFDKRGGTLVVGLFLVVMVPLPLALGSVGLLPTARSGLLMPMLFVYNTLTTTALIAVPTLLSAMLADVVEEAEVRTGRRDEGVIFALNIFMQKCATGLAIFASSAILTFAHFPANAVAGKVAPGVITRLSLTYMASIITLYVVAGVCARLYRITRSVHADHLRILAERRAGAAAPV